MSAETLTNHFYPSLHHQVIMMTLGKIQNVHNLIPTRRREEFKGNDMNLSYSKTELYISTGVHKNMLMFFLYEIFFS
jgi:hypothetical protein